MALRSLCTPASDFAESYFEALREGYQLGSDPPFTQQAIAAITADFPTHLAAITRQGRRRVFPDGSSWPISPVSLFWLIEDEIEFLGSLHLRHELTNDHARLFAGHIRYGIRIGQNGDGPTTSQPWRAKQSISSSGLMVAKVRPVCCISSNNFPARPGV
jgi:predicted acetyltransferase